jgi:uncharacterized phage-like protein YoqJ
MSSACSFTGHRAIKNEHKSRIVGIILSAIKYAYESGCREFLTGGALGFDTLAAKEVIKFRQTHPGVRLILCLPCVNQAEHWSDREKSLYDYILSSADEVVYISETYTENCMKERNFLLASKCDILVAYCGRTKSGSGQTIRMADAMGKEIINIYEGLETSNQ